jgi:hypothetical protein
LKHPGAPEMVNKCAFRLGEMSANEGKILPDRCVAEKLLNQFVSIGLSFRKEHDPGRKTIDPVDNEGALST